MHVIAPPPPESTPTDQLAELPMAFAWSRCQRHPWLGISVLVVKGFAPVCLPHDGTPHPVDPGELRTVAA